ncbi:MAG: hypothetical protein J2P54_11830 [Bradyrhizobiaceae bacterium]|nr:hypothetical protein [Bradyrhizobiaceae bacterium]
MNCQRLLHDGLKGWANWRRMVCALLLLALVGGVLHAVATSSKAEDEDATERTVNAQSRVSVQDGMTVLTLDEAARQNAGIEAARPETTPPLQTVMAYGSILDAGPLTQLRNSYLTAKMQVQTAEAKLTVARAAFERAKTLNTMSQAVSLAVLQNAEGDFEVNQATLAQAQSSLATSAASAEQTWGSVLGKGLIDGAPLVEGLIARRNYLVKVTLPPGATVAKPPATVSAEFEGQKEAQLDFISLATATDPKIQGVSYFYSVPAESELLPGMNVVVPMPTQAIEDGFVVPQSAVIWLQGKAWLYFRSGTDTFVRREIAADTPAPDGGYIVRGLPRDARIVVRGAQMLLSEEFRAQVTTLGDQD